MIIMKAPNPEVQKAALEDSERLHKEAEEALEANKKNAEEIEKNHGEDTKKPVTNPDLKAMHLSESLFEDLDVNPNIVNRLIYNLILRQQDDDGALAYDKIRRHAKKRLEDIGYYVEYPAFNRDDAFVSYQVSGTLGTVFEWGINNTKDFFIRVDQKGHTYDDIPLKDFIKGSNKIPDFYSIIGNPHSLSESLSEDLDSNDYDDFAHDLYNSIKKICFQYLDVKDNISYRDIENAIHNFLEKYEDDEDFNIFFRNTDSSNRWFKSWEDKFDEINPIKYNECLDEEIKRYSDVVPKEQRKYWYFTTHGIGPGTIPKDLHVLEIREGQNEKGTWGDFVCLDGVLNTSELRDYDMKEMAPNDLKEDLNSDIKFDNIKLMNSVMQKMNDENAYMDWINIVPDEASDEELRDIAEEEYESIKKVFYRLYKRYYKSGIYKPNGAEKEFLNAIDGKLGFKPIKVLGYER